MIQDKSVFIILFNVILKKFVIELAYLEFSKRSIIFVPVTDLFTTLH